MKACGFNTTKMNEKLGIIYFDEDALAVEVAVAFHEGDRASLLDLTEKLKAVYDKVGYKKVPKAYTLDVAVIKKSEDCYKTVIIEAHRFFSCGLYWFSDHAIIPKMFSQCWNEMKRMR